MFEIVIFAYSIAHGSLKNDWLNRIVKSDISNLASCLERHHATEPGSDVVNACVDALTGSNTKDTCNLGRNMIDGGEGIWRKCVCRNSNRAFYGVTYDL